MVKKYVGFYSIWDVAGVVGRVRGGASYRGQAGFAFVAQCGHSHVRAPMAVRDLHFETLCIKIRFGQSGVRSAIDAAQTLTGYN